VVVAYWDGADVFVRRCGNTAPALDAAVQLSAGAPLAVGAAASGTEVSIEGTVTDPNGDAVRLAVVKRLVGSSWAEMGAGSASGSGVSGKPGTFSGWPHAFADAAQGTAFVGREILTCGGFRQKRSSDGDGSSTRCDPGNGPDRTCPPLGHDGVQSFRHVKSPSK
jgi:hypothetical protein